MNNEDKGLLVLAVVGIVIWPAWIIMAVWLIAIAKREHDRMR